MASCASAHAADAAPAVYRHILHPINGLIDIFDGELDLMQKPLQDRK